MAPVSAGGIAGAAAIILPTGKGWVTEIGSTTGADSVFVVRLVLVGAGTTAAFVTGAMTDTGASRTNAAVTGSGVLTVGVAITAGASAGVIASVEGVSEAEEMVLEAAVVAAAVAPPPEPRDGRATITGPAMAFELGSNCAALLFWFPSGSFPRTLNSLVAHPLFGAETTMVTVALPFTARLPIVQDTRIPL
jgi:hypothetical protein